MTGESDRTGGRRRLLLAAAALGSAVALVLAARVLLPPGAPPLPDVAYAGSESCRDCHLSQHEAWKGSNHALAMLPARTDTVLGDFGDAQLEADGKRWRFFRRDGKFLVWTDDVAGPPVEMEIAYTFGWSPLQQYLVPLPGGRLQCLSVAWDVPNRRWFSLYPGQVVAPEDWLHWTRPAMSWNAMCSQCHSTGVRKGFDPEGDRYETTWEEISVGCEACHGPASRHVAWAKLPAERRPAEPGAALAVRTSAMPARELVNLCAPCHSRRAELRDLDLPAPEPLDTHLPALLSPGLFHADGQILDEVYEVQPFLQSRMFAKGVRCVDCHDVHSGKLRREGNALCLGCHAPETFDTPSHHHHGTEAGGAPNDGARCVSCHMPGRNYMVVHFRRDHGLRVPRPDLTRATGAPNACGQAGCHAERPLDWVVEKYEAWYGTGRKPHYGSVLAAGREGIAGVQPELRSLASDAARPALVRATALELLDPRGGEDAVAALERAIGDEDPLVRRTAVHRFPAGDASRLARAIAPRLEDPVLGVRIEAASRLAGAPAGLLDERATAALSRALDEYRATLDFSADMPSGRHNRARLEDALGRADQAERHYRKALEIDGDFYLSAVNLALLLGRQGRLEEAETLLRRAEATNPRDAAVAFNLGLLLAERGNPVEAEAALRRALVIDPALAPAAYNLAVLVGARDPAEAASLCRRAAELRPDEPRYADAAAYYEREKGSRTP